MEDGSVLPRLHQWGLDEHPSLMSPETASPGNGHLLFFRVDDFNMALKRARGLATRFDEEPHANLKTQTLGVLTPGSRRGLCHDWRAPAARGIGEAAA